MVSFFRNPDFTLGMDIGYNFYSCLKWHLLAILILKLWLSFQIFINVLWKNLEIDIRVPSFHFLNYFFSHQKQKEKKIRRKKVSYIHLTLVTLFQPDIFKRKHFKDCGIVCLLLHGSTYIVCTLQWGRDSRLDTSLLLGGHGVQWILFPFLVPCSSTECHSSL